jgi:transcription-repair coupling factor (superfamily II helicase)
MGSPFRNHVAQPYLHHIDNLLTFLVLYIDMEKERPMDRLLCGDVGYGKTEVAVRAAFKAVMEGKQSLVSLTSLAVRNRLIN